MIQPVDGTDLERFGHNGAHHRWRSFWEPTDKLVEKLFGGDLQMERVSALFNQRV